MSYVKGGVLSDEDYETLVGVSGVAAPSSAAAQNKAGYLWGVGYGDRGWGQTTPALGQLDDYDGTVVRNWSSLRTVLSTMCAWTGVSTTNLPSSASVASGAVIQAFPASSTPSIPDLLALLDNSRFNYNPANMFIASNVASSTRVGTWTSSITCELSCTFSSENQARYFFNTGGEIRIALAHTPNSTPQDQSWRNAINGLGIAFRAHSTARISGSTGTANGSLGYYELTTSYQTIHDGTNSGTGAYSSNDYYIDARAASITGLNGARGSQIYFRIRLIDQHSNAFFDTVSAGTVGAMHYMTPNAVLNDLPGGPAASVVTPWS